LDLKDMGLLDVAKRQLKTLLARAEAYDTASFSEYPLDALDATSMHAEKDRGGWRSYAGVIMERKWSDIFTMEVLLTYARPTTVVELGTGSGAFSSYLAAYCYLTRARFATFDTHHKGSVSKRVNYRTLAMVRRLGGRHYTRDVFAPATQAQIGRLVARPGVALIYCDNGDKPRELRTYLECLKRGDFIAMHDYVADDSLPESIARVSPRDLEPLIKSGRCELWNEPLCERSSSSNRFLRVIR
jgi:cephalosporin hydroxylase